MTDEGADRDAAIAAADGARLAALVKQLRSFIIQTWPCEGTPLIASALMYEVISLTAWVAQTEDEADEGLEILLEEARSQVAQFGVGKPHP